MSVGDTHAFGWAKEEELRPKLEELFGEPLTKFDKRFASHDFETSDYLIELKSRRPPTTEDTYPDYFVPACKFQNLSKDLICFYYFEQTKSLYYIIYDEEQFKSYKTTSNRYGQKTVLIPRQDWVKV